MSSNAPKGLIEQVPGRPEYVRRVVSEKDFDHYESNGWQRVKHGEGDRFKESFTDSVAGKQFAMEIPQEEYGRFAYEHMGGRLNDLQKQALNRSKKDSDHGLPGEERVTVEERQIPPQARIRRTK